MQCLNQSQAAGGGVWGEQQAEARRGPAVKAVEEEAEEEAPGGMEVATSDDEGCLTIAVPEPQFAE